MSKKGKVTLTLPQELLDDIQALAPPRGQSRFIAEAVAYYITEKKRAALRAQLIAGYQATAAEALALNEELEAADQIDWVNFVPAYQVTEPGDDGGS